MQADAVVRGYQGNVENLDYVHSPGTPATPNPIDGMRFFVRQHYLDFLRREPDQGGWDFWVSQITPCGFDLSCIDRKRVDVSRAFWYADQFTAMHPGLRNPPGVSPDFNNAESVRLCYEVYLGRQPGQGADNGSMGGYNFWLNELNNGTAVNPGPGGYDHIIRAFLTSQEYRQRFGTP